MKKNKIIKIIFSILFSSQIIIAGQSPKYQWKEIKLPNNIQYKFAEISSENDFWAYDNLGGYIYHYKDSIIQKIKFPKIKNDIQKRSFGCIKLDINKFFCIAIDTNYHTNFYIYELEKWNEFSINSNVPARNLYKISENELYICGDWGNIFHYKNNRLKKINSPIKNHVMAFGYWDKQNIWFGVRKEGIYHYDGKEFKNIPIENYSGLDVLYIFVKSENEIKIFLENGDGYVYNSNKFVKSEYSINIKDRLLYNFYDDVNGIAHKLGKHNNFFLFSQDQWYEKTLDKNYSISDCQILANGSILFSTKNKIVVGTIKKDLFFVNRTGLYNLDGGTINNSTGAAFLNYNDNNFVDIFVQNSGEEQYNNLYKNNNGHNFYDISFLSNIALLGNSNYFAIGDYDRNGKIDLLLTENDYQFKLLKLKNDSYKKKEINLEKLSLNNIRNIQLFDYDQDNDLDICNSYHYGSKKNVGNNLFLQNKFFGMFSKSDSTIIDLMSGWNNYNLFADFNNDNKIDIFIANSWTKNKLILSDKKNDYKLIKTEKNNTTVATAFDFDNDGDLDIFEVTKEKNLYLLINDSKGNFKKYSNGNPIAKDIKKFICNGDFNNDGFIDLFLSSSQKERNYLLLNDSAKTFIDVSVEIGIGENELNGAISGDIDNDGDLDIFGVRNGNNIFWRNQLDNENWLKIKINFSKTPSPGYGTKIWIYDSEHLDDQKYLIGFRQIGSNNPGTNLYSDPTAHFGVQKNNIYDIKIRFPNDRIVIKKNVSAGEIIVISEYGGVIELWNKLVGKTICLLQQSELYYNVLSFLFAISIILGGVKIGIKYFDWNNKSIIAIFVFNISIYWILINIFKNNVFYLKFIFPNVAIIFGVLVPILSSLQFYFRKNKHIKKETMEQLVNNIQIFSHGEFAMSNMNSLQLFYNNYSETMMNNDEYKKKYLEYQNTFITIILPNLEEILSLCKTALDNKEITFRLNEVIQSIKKAMQNRLLNKKSVELLKKLFKNLKEVLHDLKKNVYKEVSSEATDVVKYTVNSLSELIVNNKIEVIRQKDKDTDYWVLIKNYELADIIDNCVRNAIKSLSSRANNRKIEIRIYKILPKIIIEIKDNGKGIDKNLWDKIFESGVSSGGTGMGLFNGKKILEKYKGRIFVVESIPKKYTIFRIELLEGEKNETKIINN